MYFVNDIVGFRLYDLTQALCNHLKKTTFVSPVQYWCL